MRMLSLRKNLRKQWSLSLALIGMLALVPLSASLMPDAFAAVRTGFGFAPQRYQSGYTYGNGIFFAPYQFTVHTEPNEASRVIGEFRWGRNTSGNSIDVFTPEGGHHTAYADRVFFCFYPELDVAMMAVTSDTDDGWVEVVYQQEGQKTGWVKIKEAQSSVMTSRELAQKPEPAHFGVYQTWLEFMKLNAKANGIYWLTGVKQYHRSVRSSDTDEAKLIPVTIMRDLKVKHVRGNWLLVEVLDFERNTPIGWVRWRDDDGNLMVFPNISGKHLPIVTTAF